ncbi:MAG: LacI family DNA-binding transcriptional regulator [Opitutaceae bacterium]
MLTSKKNKVLRAATLADVGRAAGVSAMAASTVLNGARTSSRIAAGTRARILEAALRLRYRRNAAARALVNQRMDTLGVAVVIQGGALNNYFLEIFNGILDAAARYDQNTTVFVLHDWGHDPERLHNLCDGRIDGLILVAPTITRKASKLLPAHTSFVAIHSNEQLPNVVNIETDEERGAYEIVRFLIAQGHRRILHLTGPEDVIGAQRRIRGYKQALVNARIPFDSALLVPGGFTTPDGREAMRGWLKQHAGEPLPQAVFCGNDASAIGCLEGLAELGLRVPEDISVAGFDDTLAARTTVPQLTTVRQPLRAMGRRAVEVLLASIDGRQSPNEPVSPENIVFPVDLVPRASVGPPPTAERIVPPHRPPIV